ncbi:hypothetical protein BJX66DRAFT_303068 [Aspergillus keveii]|uniref:Uncharacterized protein n=1 Tax=Aspergillus keveii TaxID=714993 RepID=A0ABR4G6T8_9EURO
MPASPLRLLHRSYHNNTMQGIPKGKRRSCARLRNMPVSPYESIVRTNIPCQGHRPFKRSCIPRKNQRIAYPSFQNPLQHDHEGCIDHIGVRYVNTKEVNSVGQSRAPAGTVKLYQPSRLCVLSSNNNSCPDEAFFAVDGEVRGCFARRTAFGDLHETGYHPGPHSAC